MKAKIIYFNWYRVANTAEHDLLARATMGGNVLVDRPELYDVVGEIDLTPDETGCDVAFRAFNRVEEGDMEGLTIRSMSVGDIVLFDGPDAKMFVCKGMGWEEIPREAFCETEGKLAFWARPLVKTQSWDDNPLIGGKNKENVK